MEQIDRRNARFSCKEAGVDFVYEGSDDEEMGNMPGNPRLSLFWNKVLVVFRIVSLFSFYPYKYFLVKLSNLKKFFHFQIVNY